MMERLRKKVARHTCEVDGDGKESCEGRQMRNAAYRLEFANQFRQQY